MMGGTSFALRMLSPVLLGMAILIHFLDCLPQVPPLLGGLL